MSFYSQTANYFLVPFQAGKSRSAGSAGAIRQCKGMCVSGAGENRARENSVALLTFRRGGETGGSDREEDVAGDCAGVIR